VLEISTTTNRSDTLNMIGIAREVSALLERPLESNSYHDNLRIDYRDITIGNKIYSNYICTQIEDIRVDASPCWIKSRLKINGIEPKNNLVDIIGLLQIKWGQDFEIIEHDKIVHADDLSAKFTKPGQSYNILHLNKDREDIIIGSQILDVYQMKGTSKNITLLAGQMLLQKKGINRGDMVTAHHEAVLLIKYLCSGNISHTTYYTQAKRIYKPLAITLAKINGILGPISRLTEAEKAKVLNIEEVGRILNSLNFTVNNNIEQLEVRVPEYRQNDVSREIDLIEEIGRIYGFDYFLDLLPKRMAKSNQANHKLSLNSIRSVFRTIGLTETLHSSLAQGKDELISLYNPITEDYKSLRESLLGGLLASNSYNIKQGNEPIEMFELGRVFNYSGNTYNERVHVAGTIGGKESLKNKWSAKPDYLTWFQAKGEMEEVFEQLELSVEWTKPDSSFALHKQLKRYLYPKRVAMLLHREKAIGIFGQINLESAKELGVPLETYLFEININQAIEDYAYYKPKPYDESLDLYSKYPSVTRDIAIISPLGMNISFQEVINAVREYGDPLIESITLFDAYSVKTEISHKSLGFRVKYRSNTNTLTNEQVDDANSKVRRMIQEKLLVRIQA
jgi:phenylalanyl-tRNA synthetase beta chain